MPEGPEVRREADRIAAAIAGRRLAAVEFGLARLQPFAGRLAGREVTAVDTRGKALLIRFDNDLTLYSHNQLYGRWMVRRRGRLPRTGRSLRVALHTDSHSALLYSASEIAVLDDDGVALHPYLARLGPDLLDPALTGARVAARLASEAFRRRAVQALYLDQGFVAGVGNYLRSEILFHARVAPGARPAALSPAALVRLGRSTVTIGRRAYATGGITNPPSRVARLAARGVARSGHRFAVFDRAGQACYRCGDVIGRCTASSRRLYWCPGCQPEG
jgi:endonuclease-8